MGGRIGVLMGLWGADRGFDGFPRGTLDKWGVGGGGFFDGVLGVSGGL